MEADAGAEPARPVVNWERMTALRLARARKVMAEEGLDALLATSPDNVLYLTNWPQYRPSVHEGAYAALYLGDPPAPVLFASEGDGPFLRRDRPARDIRILPPWQRLWPPVFQEVLRSRGLEGKAVGLDGRISAALHRALLEIPHVRFVDAARAFARIRMVKNEEELRAYEHTLGVVEGAINLALRLAKESWGTYTEIQIAAQANCLLLQRGCHGVDIWCTSGHRTAPVRRYPSDKPVRGQEFFLVDGGASLNGFRAEFARTAWTGGQPAEEHRGLYRAVVSALEAARALIRPGLMTSGLERACLEAVGRAGYAEIYGGYPYTGHGIGIGAEAPYITARFPELDTPLEAGMLFNLEPGLWLEGVGGVRIEETFLVTEEGCRVLTRAPYDDALL
jgi:Xaa-Pro aminopeptidase